MREIKFREWQYQEKKMYQIDLHNEALLSTNKHDVLMQWTGLRDKNDVEIYEGDIVKLILDGKFEIIFHNASFILYNREKIQKFPLGTFSESVEVVGNIYENKELLNESKL